METTYSVWSNAVGTIYHGPSEDLADAAWDRHVALIDNDEALEPVKLRYEVNGLLHRVYESITYRQHG